MDSRQRRSIGRAFSAPWLPGLLLGIVTFINGAEPLLRINPAQANLKRGESLARQYCSGCHLWPAPDILPRQVWGNDVLPWMMYPLGLRKVDAQNDYFAGSGKIILENGLLPDEPLISEADWQEIVAYYLLKSSPHEHLGPILATKPQSARFRLRFANFTDPGPITTMLRIVEEHRSIYVGTAARKRVDVLDSNGIVHRSFGKDITPVHLAADGDDWLVTDIGSFLPTEKAIGKVLRIPQAGGPEQTLLDHLQRPVQAKAADLNGDGLTDLIVSQFGWVSGRFSWFEQLADGSYRENVLFGKPGAAHAEVRDLNGDGHPDIALLVAQATEALIFYINDGRGGFETRTAMQEHPAFGLSWFELTDFDGDGRLDILVVNGDVDYAAPPRPYHGIRILQGKADGSFEQILHLELTGAYKAIARDFDADGDFDILAIAFNPKLPSRADLGIVYFENQGRHKFIPHRFDLGDRSRWMTMDAGDVDADGDIDVVMGGSWMGPGYSDIITPEVQAKWAYFPVAYCLFENTTIDRETEPTDTGRFAPQWQARTP
jgi:hypothetical protein